MSAPFHLRAVRRLVFSAACLAGMAAVSAAAAQDAVLSAPPTAASPDAVTAGR